MDLKRDRVSFLDRLATEVKNAEGERPLLVVLPNRRSLFVLASKIGTENENVELTTIDDLMQNISGLKLIEPEELLVSFFESYCKSEKVPQSFDKFSTWAVTFLSDVNDVDLHLGDIDSLYKHIQEYHQTGEVFDVDNAGPIEGSFLRFWQRLPKYYKTLREELDRLRLAYRGLIYRSVAESAELNSSELELFLGNKVVFWVGIIPGNPSERKLLDWVSVKSKLRLFADVDEYYISGSYHEAGRLFREFPLNEDVSWRVDLLRNIEKQITYHPLPGKIAQVVRVKQILEEVGRDNWKDTVVVLTNSSMLLPFMEVFEKDKDIINITSGFPVRNTLIHRFVMTWMTLQSTATNRKGERFFYYKHLEEFLEYPIVKNWLSGSLNWQKLRDEIVEGNIKFIPISWLKEKMSVDLFAEKAFFLLFDWDTDVNGLFQRINDVLSQWSESITDLGIAHIEQKAIAHYIEKLKLLMSQFNELLPENDLKSLKKFVHRQVGYSKLFIEDPKNDALQVMGMLETRMIDFKHVIVLGATDDELPGNPALSTHIPFIHRKAYKLPTRKDTEALIAYHFYRLIQRSERLDMVYNSTSEALTSGEPSRYMLQIREELYEENKNISLETASWNVKVNAKDLEPTLIHKTEDVLEDVKAFLSRSLSPSALNKFINSPLEFYYYYVLKLKEQDEVEEDIEARTSGTIIHSVLEWVYRPFEGKVISQSELKKIMEKTDEKVEELFLQKFQESDLKSGRNLLILEMSKYYVQAFISFDLKDMSDNGPVTLVKIEDRLSFNTQVSGIDVRLFGFADRIDKRDGVYRIIDYKTGMVGSSELKYDPEALPFERKLSKSMQLALYKFMYCNIHELNDEEVEPFIISFRNFKEGYQGLKPYKGFDSTVMETIPKVLKQVIDDLLDPTQPFQHNEESEYTTF